MELTSKESSLRISSIRSKAKSDEIKGDSVLQGRRTEYAKCKAMILFKTSFGLYEASSISTLLLG